MIAVDVIRRNWITSYVLTLVTLVLLAWGLYWRLPSYRDPPFDFRAMAAGDLFNVYALTRRQEGSVKLGFAESYPPPEIGIFGNHIIRYFGGDAFSREGDPAFFFNYWYANLSLPEIYSYLRLLENTGHLPKNLLLVQITSPNADNGNFIINWGNELPVDVALNGIEYGATFNIWQFAWYARQFISNSLHEILNYNTFISALIQGSYSDRVITIPSCQSDPPAWLRLMPDKITKLFGAHCSSDVLWAYRRDGSITASIPGQHPSLPVKNEDPLKSADRGIKAGDEREIAHYIEAINDVGSRHGVRVVFIVPPVYETDRHDSVVNQVFDRALRLVPSRIMILDHRGLHDDPSLFEDSLHPSPKYYRIIADELSRRGLGLYRYQAPSPDAASARP